MNHADWVNPRITNLKAAITLPESNSSHLEMGAPWKRKFLLETIIFRCENVSFREGNQFGSWISMNQRRKSAQIITGHFSQNFAPGDGKKLRGDVSEVFDKRCKLDGRWGDENMGFWLEI